MPFRDGAQAGENTQDLNSQQTGSSDNVCQIGDIPPPFAKTVDEIDVCPPCNRIVTNEGILCESCYTWSHQPCSNLSSTVFEQFSTSREPWNCNVCVQKSRTPVVNLEYSEPDICNVCKKGQGQRSARWVACGDCDKWYHISCHVYITRG